MDKAIIYVRSYFWGAWAVRDLLAQEDACLKWAAANNLQIVKVFREKPWEGKNGKQLAQMLLYLQKNTKKPECLIVSSSTVLAEYKWEYAPVRAKFESLGVKVISIKYRLKIK